MPVKYVGAAFITEESLTVTANTTILSVTFENTGNIPIKEIKYTTDSYESNLPLTPTLNPDKTKVFSEQLPGNYQAGNTYAFDFHVIFVDKSTFAVTASIPALSAG